MSTLTPLSVSQEQVRIDHELGTQALADVRGMDLIGAVAKLRHGPGRTCEPLARVLDRAVANAREAGLDPAALHVTSGTVLPADDIVRVRRKAHGKADWIASATSDVRVEVTPGGLYEISQTAPKPPPTQNTTRPRSQPGDAGHPLVPVLRARLLDVIDPDLGINVVDLGFVRRVAIDHGTAVLTMTLTSAACPLTGVMEDQIRKELIGGADPAVNDFRIDWEWTPAWTPADITPDGREQLRAIGFTI